MAAPLPSPITPELADALAARFRVIGDPNRIRILELLRAGELPVSRIGADLGMSQQNASKHLCVLAQAGIVARRKVGTSVRYRIADEGVLALCEQVCGGLQMRVDELRSLVGGPA